MKEFLLLGFLFLACASAQSANWDLTEVAGDDWTKSAAVNRKSVNQGYTARYTEQGKLLKLSLDVHKENNVRVTDSDRLLFGMEGASSSYERAMANITMSRAETEALCKRALGKKWNKMVRLPEEDLSYLETLRLAASLNEFNMMADELRENGAIHKNSRNSKRGNSHHDSHNGGWDCVCHGTTHRFPHAPTGEGPFWGIRVLQRYTLWTAPGHTPYGFSDCLLCDHTTIVGDDTGAGFEYDCRWCCFGECVVGTDGETFRQPDDWPICNADFRFDDLRIPEGAETSPSFNYFRINDVGTCRLPRVYKCDEEVERYCVDCETFLDQLFLGDDSNADSDVIPDEILTCKYCDLVVGGNPHICPNCSYTINQIESFAMNGAGDREWDSECNCTEAMSHVAATAEYFSDSKHQYYDGYENVDYDYDYDNYNYPPDYDYTPQYEPDYDFDYRVPDYSSDYSSDYSNDYSNDYSRDYSRDYSSDYSSDYSQGDYHGDSYEAYPDYGYGPGYQYDGRPVNDYAYDYADYDYNGGDYSNDYDYDFRAHEYHESANANYDYDYRPPFYAVDYDYDFDFDFRSGSWHEDSVPQADYDFRRDYDYDYRGYENEGDHYEGDHHEGGHRWSRAAPAKPSRPSAHAAPSRRPENSRTHGARQSR